MREGRPGALCNTEGSCQMRDVRSGALAWVRSLVAAAFVAGVTYSTMNGRIGALENRLETYPPHQLAVFSTTLRRIEQQTSDVQSRVRGLERDVAVLKSNRGSEHGR